MFEQLGRVNTSRYYFLDNEDVNFYVLKDIRDTEVCCLTSFIFTLVLLLCIYILLSRL